MKKFVKFLLCLEFSFLIFYKVVNASSNPYPKIQTIDEVTTTTCTWFVWQQVNEKLGIELPRWGNAVNWYERAENNGYKVGIEAKPNSIAVWKNSNNIYGHVAYVLTVNERTMVVNEGGVTSLKLNQETKKLEKVPYNGDGIFYNNVVSLSLQRSETSLIGFIYLLDDENVFDSEENKKEKTIEMAVNDQETIIQEKPLEIKEEQEEIKKEIINNKTKIKNSITKKEVQTSKKILEKKNNYLFKKLWGTIYTFFLKILKLIK